MGLAELFLGKENPVAQWANSNRNTLAAIGGGIGSGRNIGEGLGLAAQGVGAGRRQDDAYAEAEAEKALRQQQLNQTISYLQRSYPDLADAVQSGLPIADAWNEAMKRSQPGYGQPELTANMRDWQYAQDHPGFMDFVGGSRKGNTPPAGYMWADDGKSLTYVPGGPNDPANPLNSRRTGAPQMNATIMKEVFDADDAVNAGQNVVGALKQALELNQKAWDGPWVDSRSASAALFGNGDAIATQDLKNVVTTQALDQLKAVFGGMPTEGERKILLEVQGSIDQPREVRRRIFERAIAAANRRIEANKAKAAGLRNGEYFDPDYAAPGTGTPNVGDPLGIR